jgi:hypothetical protein
MSEVNPPPRESSMGWSSRADADSPGRTSMNDFSNKASSQAANISRGDSLAYSDDSLVNDGKILLKGQGPSYVIGARTEPHTPTESAVLKKPCCQKKVAGKSSTINDSMASEDSLRDGPSASKNACCVIQ